jgi:two-component system, NarL family, response regulator DevR
MATVTETAAGTVRVFLLDDHEVVRRGVAELLEAEPDLTVVGEAATAAEALARVPAVRPDLRCLMLTSFADDDALFDAIMAGASGYVLKQIRGTDLVGAVRTVAGGQSLLDPRTTAKVLERMRTAADRKGPAAVLSEQERTVLALIGEGLTNREIGERMFLAEKTVKNYVSHLLAKLGMQRRTQAAILATELRRSGDLEP